MKQPSNKSKQFWNDEYKTKEHFALSNTVSEELEHFVRYINRNHGGMPQKLAVLDVGCGNGRNLIWLAKEYACTGVGFDFSEQALNEAVKLSRNLPLVYRVQDMHDHLPDSDSSYDLVIDFMSSHVILGENRAKYFEDIYRVLKPGGWFVLKTLLRDDDAHAHRLIRESGSQVPGVYTHPKTGAMEYAGTEEELADEVARLFEIEKKQKSHAHRLHGKANKRRFIVFYLVKAK